MKKFLLCLLIFTAFFPYVLGASEAQKTLGDLDAPATLVMYTEFGEGASKRWFEDTFPRLNQQFFSSGKANFKVKHAPLLRQTSGFEGSLAAECAAEQDRFFEYVDLLYEHPYKYSAEELVKYATNIGLNKSKFSACLQSEQTREIVRNELREAEERGVVGLPSFFVEDFKMVGNKPYSAIAYALDEHIETVCLNRCDLNQTCVDTGYRSTFDAQNFFCQTGEWIEQKQEGSACQNNYECYSNSCSNGECIDLKKEIGENRALLQRILDWISNFFE